ncbi:DNA polymerase epsilon subunit C [[Candida] zeylanoides]
MNTPDVDTPTTTPLGSATASPDVIMDGQDPAGTHAEGRAEDVEGDAEADTLGTEADALETEADAVEEDEAGAVEDTAAASGLDGDDDDTLTLPLSKIKKIFKMDPDYVAASQSAVYATGLATELFIQHMVEQAASMARMGKRKKINYVDFSDAVKGHESLMFLRDTVPEKKRLDELIAQKVLDASGQPSELDPTAAAAQSVAEEEATPPPPPTGQQIFQSGAAAKDEGRPLKKAVITDLIASGDDMAE